MDTQPWSGRRLPLLLAVVLGSLLSTLLVGTGSAQAARPVAPARAASFDIVQAPRITGTPRPGQTLTADPGKFSPVPESYTFVWLADGTPVAGATEATYPVTSADLGHSIQVTVTAARVGYVDATVTSRAVGPVLGAMTASSSPAVVVTGTPAVGRTLTAAQQGSITPTPDTVSYLWSSDGTPIAGATGSSYTLASSDLGHSIQVTLTATKAGYEDARFASATVGPVQGAAFTTAPVASIRGTPIVGQVLTALTGPVVPSPDKFSVAWYADTVRLGTGSTYTLTSADVGRSIRVEITASKAGYVDATGRSAAIGPVRVGFTSTANPAVVITGTPSVGRTLSATLPGTFSPTPDKLTYAWSADGTPIAGATAATYVVTAADLGHSIQVTVTASRTGLDDGRFVSAAVGPVLTTFTVPPTASILGTPVVGRTLSALTGDITPVPDQVSYVWLAGGAVIPGATSSTYTPTLAQLNASIQVRVTASKSGYDSATSLSPAVGPVKKGALDGSPGPITIIGTPAVGNTLTADTSTAGVITPAPDQLTYAWYAGGVPIPGATDSSYTLTAAEVSHTIKVKITASKTGYDSVSVLSPAVGPVKRGFFDTTTMPVTITGTPTAGKTLTAVADGFTPTPEVLTYAWYAGGVLIPGATSSTYTLTDAELNHSIKVKVTVSRSGYESTTVLSDAVGPVARTFPVAPSPVVSGNPVVGGVLVATPGDFSPTPDLVTYAWLADGVTIAGATGSTYAPTPADVGHEIRVVVTATKTGYETTSVASSAVGPVRKGLFSSAPRPTITGSAKVGRFLIAVPGTIAPGPDQITYAWFVGNAEIPGATGPSLQLTRAQAGARIKVKVTVAKLGYVTTSAFSAATGAVRR